MTIWGCALGDALMVNTTLTSLTLITVGVEAYGAGALALFGALKLNTTLTSFTLEARRVYDNWGRALGDALMVNTALTSFTLHADVDSDGVLALCDALKVNTTLTSFTLQARRVDGNGFFALGDALKVNTTLTSFTLQARPDCVVGRALGDALKVNTTLTSWTVHVHEVDGEVFSDALRSNYFLTKVDVSGWPPSSLDLISWVVQRNKDLRVLWRDLALITQKSRLAAMGAVVDALTDLGFRRAVFSYFLPAFLAQRAPSISTAAFATDAVIEQIEHSEPA